MDLELTYDEDRNGVSLLHHGITRGDELMCLCRSVIESKEFSTFRYWISDRTGCKEYLVNADHMIESADLTREHFHRNPNMVVAMVSPDDRSFGLGHMYQILAGDDFFTTMVFRERKYADIWIEEQLVAQSL